MVVAMTFNENVAVYASNPFSGHGTSTLQQKGPACFLPSEVQL